MYGSLRLRTARSGRYPEFGGRLLLGGVNAQCEGKKTSVPELAFAIWSESGIGGGGGGRHRRFHYNRTSII